MFVDFRGERANLAAKQKQFLKEIVPLSAYISGQIYDKCLSSDPPRWTAHGIHTSVIVGHIIVKSEWGKHPISQPRYQHPSEEKIWEHANNLTLMEVDPAWRRPSILHKGVNYKGFKDRYEFAIEISSQMAWTDQYMDVLSESSHKNQIRQLSMRETSNWKYSSKVAELIKSYKLWEFDGC
jgi:hypothetical protein